MRRSSHSRHRQASEPVAEQFVAGDRRERIAGDDDGGRGPGRAARGRFFWLCPRGGRATRARLIVEESTASWVDHGFAERVRAAIVAAARQPLREAARVCAEDAEGGASRALSIGCATLREGGDCEKAARLCEKAAREARYRRIVRATCVRDAGVGTVRSAVVSSPSACRRSERCSCGRRCS